MIIWDTLYGRFELPKYLERLVTAPEFRRLAEIRLININSPALAALADVRRYSHTLGALRLAMENPLLNFGEDEHRALLASMIVHDAGTPAFAHLFEYQLHERFNWDHESIVRDIMLKQHHADARSHQFFASRRPEFESLCTASNIDFQLVLAILERRHPGSQLVFGSLDFDNLDNVARMNWMLGNRFDPDFILELAASLGTDATAPLLLPEAQRKNLEQWATLRRQAYEVLVFDAPTVAGQAVLSTVIAEALQKKFLSAEDWHYNDHELLNVLRSSSIETKNRLELDFFGRLPELKLIAHLQDKSHPLFSISRERLSELIRSYLQTLKVSRPYGYSLRDRGTFEKRISAVDPTSGRAWTVGKRSDSLILYGFGRGGGRNASATEVGKRFIDWVEKTAC